MLNYTSEFRLQVPEDCSYVLLNIFSFRNNHKRKCTIMKFRKQNTNFFSN